MSECESVNYMQKSFLGGICEAIAASWLNEQFAASGATVYWYGGNNSLVDVEVEEFQVDVKRAFIEGANWRNEGPVPCLGFMGTTREQEARDGVSHYFLVVPTESPWVELHGPGVSVSYESPVRMFLVPRGEINQHFQRAYTAKTGGLGKGLNKFYPIELASQWEVFFKPNEVQ